MGCKCATGLLSGPLFDRFALLVSAARIERIFRHYGGIFFHSVPTKRGSAGACSGSTSLQTPFFVRLAFLFDDDDVI